MDWSGKVFISVCLNHVRRDTPHGATHLNRDKLTGDFGDLAVTDFVPFAVAELDIATDLEPIANVGFGDAASGEFDRHDNAIQLVIGQTIEHDSVIDFRDSRHYRPLRF
jgi:hypothetical protein